MAAAAEPVLASSLWGTGASGCGVGQKLRTGCDAIDKALGGGLDHGSITCISVETGVPVQTVTQALLVSHLSSSDSASATVIDTGQAIDVRRLLQAMLATATATEDAKDAAHVKAKAKLRRVKIMKAFDFEGLTEGLGELRDVLEDRAAPHLVPRGTVADSQDGEDEMLDSPTPAPLNSAVPSATIATTIESKGPLLIVDNITQLAAPLLKANHATGQALIVSFMRSLAHLTTRFNMSTVIVNSTIFTKTPNYKEESPSAFSSCSVRPALGKTWTCLVDMHLLVHQMPCSNHDAKVVYGGTRAVGDVKLSNVMECLQDRREGKVGRWTAFTESENDVLHGCV